MFEFLDHTADTRVRLTAADFPGLVQSGAAALRCLYLGDGADGTEERAASGAAPKRIAFALEAEDAAALLIEFLNELIFQFDARRFLCSRVEIEAVCLAAPARLRGQLVGELCAETRNLETEVKAATFHAVQIGRKGARLTVDVVFDL